MTRAASKVVRSVHHDVPARATTRATRRTRLVAGGVVLSAALLGLTAAGAAPTGAQVSPPNPALLPWGATSPLPEPRSRFGAVYGNGFLYVVGGIDATGATTATTSFAPVNADGSVGPWAATTPLPGPRRTVRPAFSNGFLYVAGGNDGTAYHTEVYRAAVNADGTLGAWTASTPLPVAQTSHSTIASNGYLYVVGGNNGTTCVSTVRYAPINADGSLGAWATTSAMPGDRCGNVEAVAIANGYLYAAGGYNNITVASAVFSAPVNPDGTLGAWQTSPNALTTPREYNAVEVLNGYLYVIGGQPALTGTSTTSVEVAQLGPGGAVGPFTPTTDLPGPRSEAASEVVNGRIHVIGGGTDQSGGDPQASVYLTTQATAGDTTPPAVVVTAPPAGAVLSGSVEVTADASDNTAVAGVQFLLDGNPLGAEDTTAPYSVTWDTSTAANGAHTLSARARDTGGNQTLSAAVDVTVATPTTPTVAYGLEQGTGVTALDSSPNANHATLTGGAWTPAGRYGNAVTFDGATFLRATTDIALGPAFTYQAWILNPDNADFETILTVGRDRDLYLANGVPSLWTGTTDLALGDALPAGTWTHLVITYDGATLQAYVNGVPSGPPTTATIEPTAAPLQIGAWLNGTDNSDFFRGTLDEVRVYNRALTPAEIQADLATPISAPPDTTPPTVSDGQPTGTLPAGTTSTTLQVTTDEAATCRYDTVAGIAYASMASAFATTGGTAHATPVTGLVDGQSSTSYVRCQDAAGNATTTDAVITFAVATAPPPSPAAAAYGLEQGTGVTALDSSPNANHATLTGGAWTPTGRYGNAVTFDGATRLRATTDITLGPSFTYEAWLNDPVNDAYETILTVGRERDLFLAGGVPSFWDGTTGIALGDALPAGTWTHLAVTYDGTQLQAYVNGAPYGSAVVVSLGPTADALHIGAWVNPGGDEDYLTGTLDEVRVYNRALTPAEIQADLATPIQLT